MITPINTLTISQICDRKDDLLISKDDIEQLAKNCKEKALKEYQEIGTIEEFKSLKEMKERIIQILRTHRFSDDECVEKITKLVGIYIS